MPLYDLICDCGHIDTDRQMSVVEYEKVTCPDCGKKLKSRLNSIVFNRKGVGWTPRYHGVMRTDRTRDDLLKEEMYEGKKNLKRVNADREREKERRPIYIT